MSEVLNDFDAFRYAINHRMGEMSGAGALYRVAIEPQQLWAAYLASFPEGSDPIFVERTVHNCTACRKFIQAAGGVVQIQGRELLTIWDMPAEMELGPYETVAAKMAELVRQAPIENRALFTSDQLGTAVTESLNKDGRRIDRYTHLHGKLRVPNVVTHVVEPERLAQHLAVFRDARHVLERGLLEIKMEAIERVLELIRRNNLYRGEEYRHRVQHFKRLHEVYWGGVTHALLTREELDYLLWTLMTDHLADAGIRNTVIGTLLLELSDPAISEARALGNWRHAVDPRNFRHSDTSKITETAIAHAHKEIEALGLTSALQRRYAVERDVSVNDVLFVNRTVRSSLRDALTRGLAALRPTAPQRMPHAAQTVPIDVFIRDFLPGAQDLEVRVTDEHRGNFVSLIAPVDETAGRLFRWNNAFSWSYAGDVADSIRERVKRAGGNVTGDICCRLAWSNHDDLDFHMREPPPRAGAMGYQIFFQNKGRMSPNGGMLDVDMNAGHGQTRQPVENIVYVNAGTMHPGTYRLAVHQYCLRERTGVGFEVEIQIGEASWQFSHRNMVPHDQYVQVANIVVPARGRQIQLQAILPVTLHGKARTIWNLQTDQYHPVKMVMLSPNHWQGAGPAEDTGIGNKHWFFMLKDCRNEATARGFYNEFLRGDLDRHRRVFELAGAQMRTEESDQQLSGLGFSSTQRHELAVKLDGRPLTISF